MKSVLSKQKEISDIRDISRPKVFKCLGGCGKLLYTFKGLCKDCTIKMIKDISNEKYVV